mmetsp:Transcript_3153/g.3054  ORF Transcript_3153/g.3054 Transcript_3153/m.3054 type:complete len:357 (+) Transcript_3153:344-1414(+)
MEGRILLNSLHEMDDLLKEKAAAYYRQAKDAEESYQRYESMKYSAELSFQHKQIQYDMMLASLKKAKERESLYKECVDNSNGFVLEFRAKQEALCKELLDMEAERCEAIHGSINKFVVYEKFAEMNNKYDVKNFSKLIEEYDNSYEVAAIITHLNLKMGLPEPLGPELKESASVALQETTSSVNNSMLEESNPDHRLSQVLSKGTSEVLTLKRDESVPSFKFVQYESARLNLGKLNSALITPPQERLSYYNEDEAILKYIFNKIFSESSLHEEYYLALNNILSSKEKRKLLMELLEKRFNKGAGTIFISKANFNNVKESVDIFLYECNKDKDIEGLLQMTPYLSIFQSKAMASGMN